MEFSKFYIEEYKKTEKRNNFITNVAKELSLIGWVTIVFMLIVLSYFENENVFQENTNIDTYDLSISEEINEELNLEIMKM